MSPDKHPGQEDIEALAQQPTATEALGVVAARGVSSGELTEPRIENAAELIDRQGFVEPAPLLADLIKDENRTTPFRYVVTDGEVTILATEGAEVRELSEHEGLVEFDAFLGGYIALAEQDDSLKSGVNDAKMMREHLLFIGSEEFGKAAKGLGEYWKQYLDKDPSNELWVSLGVTEHFEGVRKSDVHVLESILQTFSDDEVSAYQDRIKVVTESGGQPTKSPEHTKIVVLDDWTLTGKHLRHSYNALATKIQNMTTYAGSVEVNLLAAHEIDLRDGFSTAMREEDMGRANVPVKAYYKTSWEGITGLHASTDYEFDNPVSAKVKQLRSSGYTDAKMPPLTNVIREYRHSKSKIIIKPDGSIERFAEEGLPEQ